MGSERGDLLDRAWCRLAAIAGGRTRAIVVLLLACVLGTDTADISSVGSVAGKLEAALALNNTDLGLVAAIPSAFAALSSLPFGVFTDRVDRVRMLWLGMLACGVAEAASGFAQSYATLLLIRLAVGGAIAVSGPAVASLVGDYFPAPERGGVWGLILSGELLGAAFGYLISGEFASLGSWRYAFFALAIPSVLIAVAIRKLLREPPRGGRGRLQRGANAFVEAGMPASSQDPSDEPEVVEKTEQQAQVEQQAVEPDSDLVLVADPLRLSMPDAIRYVLRIRTNVVLIVASGLGYFYFTGVQTFDVGIVFIEDRHHESQGIATLLLAGVGLSALVGVVLGGRLSDRFLRDGHVNSRIVVAGVSFVLAALLFLPGLLVHALWLAMVFYVIAGIAFGARNPPADAARLDIMHQRLWGRAEAVRTFLRGILTAGRVGDDQGDRVRVARDAADRRVQRQHVAGPVDRVADRSAQVPQWVRHQVMDEDHAGDPVVEAGAQLVLDRDQPPEHPALPRAVGARARVDEPLDPPRRGEPERPQHAARDRAQPGECHRGRNPNSCRQRKCGGGAGVDRQNRPFDRPHAEYPAARDVRLRARPAQCPVVDGKSADAGREYRCTRSEHDGLGGCAIAQPGATIGARRIVVGKDVSDVGEQLPERTGGEPQLVGPHLISLPVVVEPRTGAFPQLASVAWAINQTVES